MNSEALTIGLESGLFVLWEGSYDDPCLVETIVAVPESQVLVVLVLTSPDIEAFATVVSEISSGSSKEADSLIVMVGELSNDSCLSNSETLSNLVGNDMSSLGKSSNGVSS